MEAEMKLDKWGYEVRTRSDACISAINSYYNQVLSYGRERSVIPEAPKSDPECVLGNILAAHFLCSSDSSRAPEFIDAAKSHLEYASSYKKAVFEAIKYFISSDRDDDLAVQMHSEVLPVNDHEDYIYGLVAFPLPELGRIKDAEKAGKRGYDHNKNDSWSHHALCHVYQYECRFKEAAEFMNIVQDHGVLYHVSCVYTHNWWHVALCYLEGHAPMIKIREIYDECIWKELERSDATPPEVYLNALGLLLRVYIRGAHDIFKDRLNDLANRVTDQAVWFLEWHLVILISWALSFTGRYNEAEDLLKGLKSRVSMMTKKKQRQMHRALALAEALYKYGKGNYKEALELLRHDFDAINYKIIGALNEQLDVFTEVHITLLLETGEASAAVQAIQKQLNKREGAPFLWSLLEAAASYGEKAKQLESSYFT
ncbi:hypothetical protein OROMI_027663 [Orobanche minor]